MEGTTKVREVMTTTISIGNGEVEDKKDFKVMNTEELFRRNPLLSYVIASSSTEQGDKRPVAVVVVGIASSIGAEQRATESGVVMAE